MAQARSAPTVKGQPCPSAGGPWGATHSHNWHGGGRWTFASYRFGPTFSCALSLCQEALWPQVHCGQNGETACEHRSWGRGADCEPRPPGRIPRGGGSPSPRRRLLGVTWTGVSEMSSTAATRMAGTSWAPQPRLILSDRLLPPLPPPTPASGGCCPGLRMSAPITHPERRE